jgi:hypothetical protein
MAYFSVQILSFIYTTRKDFASLLECCLANKKDPVKILTYRLMDGRGHIRTGGHTWTNGHAHGRTYRWTDTQTHGRTGTHTDGRTHMDRYKHGRTRTQTDERTDTHTNGHTD